MIVSYMSTSRLMWVDMTRALTQMPTWAPSLLTALARGYFGHHGYPPRTTLCHSEWNKMILVFSCSKLRFFHLPRHAACRNFAKLPVGVVCVANTQFKGRGTSIKIVIQMAREIVVTVYVVCTPYFHQVGLFVLLHMVSEQRSWVQISPLAI